VSRRKPSLEVIDAHFVAMRSASLRLMLPQTLVISWLAPRLPEFYAQGGRQIDLLPGTDPQRVRAGEVELAILERHPENEDLPGDELIELQAAVVAAPIMPEGRRPPSHTCELRDHRLLTAAAMPCGWKAWFASGDLGELPAARLVHCESLQSVYEAAAAGHGVALATPLSAEALLRTGRLTFCFPNSRASGTGYRLVYATDTVRRRREVQQLYAYLRVALRKSEAQFFRQLRNALTPPQLLPQIRFYRPSHVD
jgi:LysR family transcriptional regulator, glycine cleavage system transcriptional activator